MGTAPAPVVPAERGVPVPAVSSRPRVALAVLVVLFLLLAGAYNQITPATPTDHNPDEIAHFLYMQTLAAGHLPVFHAGRSDYEAHQPPLYYTLCLPVYLATRTQGEATAMRAVRAVSIVLGAALIVVVFFCVMTLLPGQPLYALAAAGFVGLLPMNVSLSASVSNDSLTDLLMVVALWQMTRLVQDLPTRGASDPRWTRRCVWLGVTLGLGIWTKTSTLLLVPTFVVFWYLLARCQMITPSQAGRAAGISIGLGLLLSLPWLVRNQILYGDPIAQHIFQTAFTGTAQARPFVVALGWPIYLLIVAQWTFASFWGVFDCMRLFWGQDPQGHTPSAFRPLGPIYGALAVVSIFAVLGLRDAFRAPAISWTPTQKLLLQTFGVLIVLTWLAHLRFITVFFQAQGRYWYPALLPLALFFVLGLRGLSSQPFVFRVLVVVMVLGLLVLNLYTLLGLLLPHYYPA